MRGNDHPHDACLIARHFDPSPADERFDRHVSTCPHCAARQREIAAVFDDEHGSPQLTDAWLDAQRRRILERLRPAWEPRARVIPFPRKAVPTRSIRPRLPMRSRLAAVATILALLGAAGAGWVIETQRHEALRLRAAEAPRSAPRVLPGGTQPSQDALLGDIDMALASPQTPALRALDALTAGAADPPHGR